MLTINDWISKIKIQDDCDEINYLGVESKKLNNDKIFRQDWLCLELGTLRLLWNFKSK